MNYSFIIPHKNVPSLLVRCLQTIPVRDDVEVIIVDDCSDPSVVDFDKFPGLNRKNCECVFLKQSKGAGHARNIGIEKATGKWLLFADADDFYTENIFKLLDDYTDESDADIVYLNAQSFFEKDGMVAPQSFSRYFERYEKHRFYSEKVIRYNIWTPWSRMVKRDLVLKNNIKYEEIPVGNDKMFCLNCSKYANTIAIESNVIYNYYVPQNGSVTYTYSNNINSLKQRLELQFRANKLYSDVGFVFKQSYLYNYYRGNLRDKKLKPIYLDFMKTHSVSFAKDIYYMILTVIGRLLKII